MIHVFFAFIIGGISSITITFSSKNHHLNNREVLLKAIGALLWGMVSSILYIVFFGNINDLIGMLKSSVIVGMIAGIIYNTHYNYVKNK
ncbi:hypothetical protein [Gracilibacillus timonensis]|uniref:hypothetical protein n=1 Tax=Gracilibacillus timonensis TaxID=1816696 RepID=UPI000824D1E5|nr:hypothetical protein [Gracilibacillus timonensis]